MFYVTTCNIITWRGGRVAEGNGLLNRRTGKNSYRGFESRPLRYVVFPLVKDGAKPRQEYYNLSAKLLCL